MIKIVGIILFLPMVLLAQPAPQQGPANKVVARIDGKDWTADAVKAWVATLPIQVQNAYARNPAETMSKTLVLQHLAELGELHHLDQEPSVQQNLAWTRQDFLSQGELNHVRESYEPPAEETKRFYEDNPQRWERAIVRAIYVSVSVKRSEESAQSKVEDLWKQLEGGADLLSLHARTPMIDCLRQEAGPGIR